MGRTADGTAYYAAPGTLTLAADGDRVRCHLCGAWLRRIAPGHLERRHGWRPEDYRAAFGLNPTAPLQAPAMSIKQSEIWAGRLLREPTLASSGETARQRMREGAVSSGGRPRSPQARERMSRARTDAAKQRSAVGRTSAARSTFESQQQLAAEALGHRNFDDLYSALRSQGLSLRAIAKTIGRDPGWVARTSAREAERQRRPLPAASEATAARLDAHADAAGYDGIGALLAARFAARLTARAVAAELGIAPRTLTRLRTRLDPLAPKHVTAGGGTRDVVEPLPPTDACPA